MAVFDISNSWGAGFDMSGYSDEGWGYMPADRLTGTVYQGQNTIIFDAYGYASFDALGIKYFLYPDGNTLVLEDIIYFRGGEIVYSIDNVNLQTTISDLNSTSWYVRFNPGNDTFYGNDYADVIKAGYGDDFVLGYLGNDALYGNDGDDTLGGGGGDDLLVGGNGYDTVSYGDASTNFALKANADGSVTVTDRTGGWGTDLVYGVEAFYFADGMFSLSSLLPPSPPALPLPPGSPATPETIYSGNNTLYGTSGSNVLKGYGGNDKLYGQGGNDHLYGGNGNDILYGGTGRDSFVFNTKANKYTNKDAIKDFRVIDDTIRLDNAVFTKVGANGTLKSYAFWSNDTGKAHDKDDRVIYDKNSGVLYYDADGSGKGASVAFATISKNLGMTHKDFYIV
jgi:Ca2+-binding RTX toxin-like protein